MQCVVLCPDGHRVTIKMNRQTPLLTILEEACSKRKLDPVNHALRRENDRANVPNLDTSLTIGFAGIFLIYFNMKFLEIHKIIKLILMLIMPRSYSS